ncbi:hypothetical protein FA95DRAFT_1479777, partial [Auriscalpium vulgare]
DCLLCIIDASSLETLSALRGTNVRLRCLINGFLTRAWNTTLEQHFHDALGFREILRVTGSIVSGSHALYFALRNTEWHQWQPSDLDVYCPVAAGLDLVEYLVRREGYKISNPFEDSETRCLYQDVGGIATVVTLRRTSGQKVDIIVGTGPSALATLTHFWGTAVINFISADTICVTYPRLTLRGVCCISTRRHRVHRLRVCVLKYVARGFIVGGFSVNGVRSFHASDDPYCPHTERSFFDNACLTIHFGRDPPAIRGTPCVHPVWGYGGNNCGGHCDM